MPAVAASRQRTRLCFLLLLLSLLLLSLGVMASDKKESNVNQNVKRKRDAKAKAKKKFLDKHGIVFDSYGRVVRWGKEPLKYDCKENAKLGLYCTVIDSKVRKYRTKEEDRRGKMIKLDKQAELDGQFGSGSEDAKRARRRRHEDRRRCGLYKDWLTEFEKPQNAENKRRAFYDWLRKNFEDFDSLRKVKPGRRGVRKARKIYRNIAREIHSDKLPKECSTEEMMGMMAEILGKVESIRDCIAEPHTCSEDEL